MNVGATSDHIGRNRGSWDQAAAEHEGPGRENWAAEEPVWGIWGVPESQVGVLPAELEGRDVVELGCGTGDPPEGSTTLYPFVTLDWALRWPCEEVWKARRLG